MPIAQVLSAKVLPSVVLPGSVRVRIAPSPTGFLHVGTARTALFNLLFARKHQGVFVLRIEDTDRERSDPKFEKEILENLTWLGISWDEGVAVGGEYAPYRQSERIYTYAKHLERVLEEQKAYHCFCSEEELHKDREEARAKNIAPRYVGRCALLSETETRQRLGRGERSILRLRVAKREITFRDLVRGEITFDTGLLGDIAIAKTPSIPLYNFAVVVDDFEMKITHVLRGEDHIANTPKQILVAEALGINSPEFAHIPLVLGPDRSKLSKRHGATGVKELRDAGYYPEAVVNFLALLGWNPGTDKELFTLEELAEEFTLERVQKSGAVWNQEKLDWFNVQFLKIPQGKRWLTSASFTTPEFRERISGVFREAGLIQTVGQKEKSVFKRIAPLILERISLVQFDPSALVQDFGFFFRLPEYPAELLVWKSMSKEVLKDVLGRGKIVLEAFSAQKFDDPAALLEVLLREASAHGDRGEFLWPLRVALSGQKTSPGPHEIASILGKEETIRRISHALILCDV